MYTKLIKYLKIILLPVIIYILAVTIRFGVYEENVKRVGNMFTQECAFHYYFTKLVDKYSVLPAVDYNIQSPEGFRTSESESMLMEYVVGYLHRIFFNKIELDKFVSFFVILFSSLSSIALYLIAKEVLNSRSAGFFSGVLYAVSWPSIARTMGLVYLKENFALPILFFHIYFLIKFLRNKKRTDIIISSILLFVLLASWHFGKFYFLLLSFFALVSLLFNIKDYLKAFGFLVLAGILGGVAVSFLRANAFIISIPMCLGYSCLISWFVVKGKWPIKLVISLALFFILIFIISGFSKEMTNYSHVYNMLFYKLKFLGMKPLNPEILPFEVRQLWVMAFHLPTLKSFLSDFTVLLLLSAYPVYYLFKRRSGNGLKSDVVFLMYMFAGTFLMYLLSARLRSFFVFFAAIFSGGIIAIFIKSKHKKIIITSFVLLSIALYSSNVKKLIFPLAPTSTKDLVSWIDNNTGKTDVFLSTPFDSVEICAYGDRPIVLHPKYETKLIRDKIEKFTMALFSDNEDDFYDLCRDWKVDYFVFPKGTYLGEGVYSWRYFSAKPAKDYSSNAYKFEALPQSTIKEEKNGYNISVFTGFVSPDLKHFELVFRNKDFNVYKVKL